MEKSRLTDLRQRLNSQAASWLIAPGPALLVSPLTRRSVTHRGLKISTQHPAFSRRIRARLFWNLYERAEIDFIRKYLVGAEVVVELGSSLGVTTRHIISVMAPAGSLACVEPNPAAADVLARGLLDDASPHQPKVVVLRKAIAGSCGEAMFEPAVETLAGALASEEITPRGRSRSPGPGPAGHPVETTTLAGVIRELQMPSYALVCDIEGAEASFIMESAPSILQACSVLIIELHSTTHSGETLELETLLNTLIDRHDFKLIERRGPVVAMTR